MMASSLTPKWFGSMDTKGGNSQMIRTFMTILFSDSRIQLPMNKTSTLLLIKYLKKGHYLSYFF